MKIGSTKGEGTPGLFFFFAWMMRPRMKGFVVSVLFFSFVTMKVWGADQLVVVKEGDRVFTLTSKTFYNGQVVRYDGWWKTRYDLYEGEARHVGKGEASIGNLGAVSDWNLQMVFYDGRNQKIGRVEGAPAVKDGWIFHVAEPPQTIRVERTHPTAYQWEVIEDSHSPKANKSSSRVGHWLFKRDPRAPSQECQRWEVDIELGGIKNEALLKIFIVYLIDRMEGFPGRG